MTWSIVSKPGQRFLRAGSAVFSRAASALAVAMVVCASSAAQTRQEQGRLFVEQALQALGGDAFLKVSNTVQTGRAYAFYRQNVRGLAQIRIYDRYEPMKPDAEANWLPVSRREVYTQKGDYYSLFINGQGWEVTFRGARPLPEERLHRYRESTRRDIFYFLRYRLDEEGMYYYHKGTEIIDNVPTEAVDITDKDSESITVYFRRSDRLPVQQVYTRRDPKTRIPYEERSVFSKYRTVNGVKLPWNVRHERDGEKTFELFGRTLEINQKLKDDVFSLKGLEVLPPAP